jgi:putative two-component system response regulator
LSLTPIADTRLNGKILVVDDDLATREFFSEVLTAHGFNIFTARDGIAAVELFSLFQPDLVLLDVQMPGRNGFEVCQELKGRPETRLTPVVLVTGLSETEDRVQGLEAGADDFLTKPVDRSELLARVRSLISLKNYTDDLDRAESVLFALAASIEARDSGTAGHCERLSAYSVHLGEHLGLPQDQINALRRGGYVHDIGKVAVPDSILLKPGPLTPEERLVLQQHPVTGERICAPLRSFSLVLPIIRHHHEKWDGSGYPDGLRGEEIPLTARVLQIIDIYDSLITNRPYRAALPPEAALRIMEEEVRRNWWDFRVFAEFKRLLAGVPANGDLILR